ncbi:hypothetical protein MVES1_000657 [Malassezia vespertilionis]|uniref:UDENN domain-containing protein n=1 Tax=Malassezia vespertilionis TaxID=2020962 RepID=A0A2N1JH20_9BASI|nr:uncharacterized protein MVES1_000657 [Malassezia vespertilionis]PKI85842.1 hypothetical protein MVES_000609 [Malassezia vespertilionis]WFD05327.1 hypothetical protein MVES1_000657 [Malassezia vespertilionis]
MSTSAAPSHPQFDAAAQDERHSSVPSNIRGIFVAEFLVKEGNTIVYSYPDNLDVNGFEWKTLPSGAHNIKRDIIYFEPGQESASFFTFCVAAFRARKLSPSEMANDIIGLRGLRALSVGVVIACSSSDVSDELTQILPHIAHLEALADRVIHGEDPSIVQGYAERFLLDTRILPMHVPAPQPMLECLEYDPVTYLCAVNRFLGPLIVPLLKFLQLPRKRLLLYCPPPTERAAIIAYNLAELVRAAFLHMDHKSRNIRVRGLYTVLDLEGLLEEANTGNPAYTWIAWTTDKLFLERTTLYDIILDVSPFVYPDAHCQFPAACPMAKFVSRPENVARTLRWSTTDVTLFWELAEQERRYEQILEEHGRQNLAAWKEERHGRNLGMDPMRVVLPPTWRYLQQDARFLPFGYAIIILATVRFWMTEWWLVRSQLQVVLPSSLVFPLGVRDDGGMSMGIVDLTGNVVSDEQGALKGAHESFSASKAPQHAMDDDDSLHAESAFSSESLDPLVLACGIHPDRSSTPFCSRSGGNSPSRARHVCRDRSIIPAHPRFSPMCAPHLPQEIMASVYLFTLWSSYIRAMHVQASAFLAGRIEKLPTPHAAPTASTPLLHRGTLPYAVFLTPKEVSDLSLDSNNDLDLELLRSITATHEPCALHIEQAWWSSWFA